MRIAKIKPLVRQILIEQPETRKDDFKLISEVITKLTNEKDITYIALNHKVLGIPSFESITRVRRAIQKEDQSLIDWHTADKRASEEQEYIESSRKGEI